RAGLGGLAGIVVANAAGHLVKQVACRARPRLLEGWGVDAVPDGGTGSPPPAPTGGSSGAGEFFHWPCFVDSRYQSFPSGHATTAFAVAAALVRAAPGRRRLWLAVAAGVGASRVALNAHFVADVVAGALLGWWGGGGGQGLADRLGPRGVTPAPIAGAAVESRPGGPPA